MSLNITVTAGHNFPADVPVTLEALRQAALPSVSIAGSVATGDLGAGAVTPAKCAPGAYWFADATFSDTDPSYSIYSVTLDPALTGLADGVEVWFKTPAESNNTKPAKLNVNSLGSKLVVKQNGETLTDGDIRSNTVYGVRYNEALDSAAGGWQLFTPVGNGSRYVTTTGSANAYIYTNGATPNTPTATSLDALIGTPIYFKANFANTGAATLAVDGLAAKYIRKHGDQALTGGEIVADQIVCVVYDAALNGAAGGFMLLSHVNQPVIVGAARGLRVTVPSVSTVTVKADEVTVRAGNNDHLRVSSVDTTVNIAATGAGGRTTTNEDASTKYWLWVISQEDGTTKSAVLAGSSVLATALLDPQWPAGYTYGALVGAVYNNGSSNIDRHWEFGERQRFFSPAVNPLSGSYGKIAVSEAAHGWNPETPSRVEGFARCTEADAGYTAGDTVNLNGLYNTGGAINFTAVADATNVFLVQNGALVATNPTGGTRDSAAYGKWVVFIVAEL